MTSPADCPVCGSSDPTVVSEVGAAEAAQHYVLREVDPERNLRLAEHIRELWNGDRCRVVRCRTCELCYADPFVGGDAEFYAMAYTRSGYPARKWEYAETRRVLRASPSSRRRTLLELGAGNGAFVRSVSPEYFLPEDIVTTEFSEYGRQAIASLGIRCESLHVRDLPAEHNGRYDVVCLFQVLEHLDQLDAVLSRIVAVMRGRAHLFVAVPSDHKVAFNESHGALLDMPPNHISRWNRRSFEALGERYRLRLLEHRYERESWLAMAMRFLAYRYLRDSQESGSLANRIRTVRSRPLRRLLEGAWVGLSVPSSARTLVSLRRRVAGDSQWVCFERVT